MISLRALQILCERAKSEEPWPPQRVRKAGSPAWSQFPWSVCALRGSRVSASVIVGEKSPFHSLTCKKANKKRTLVLRPVSDSCVSVAFPRRVLLRPRQNDQITCGKTRTVRSGREGSRRHTKGGLARHRSICTRERERAGMGLFNRTIHSFQHPEVAVFGLPFERCMDCRQWDWARGPSRKALRAGRRIHGHSPRTISLCLSRG